jgi:hypothetical protein
MDSTAKPTPAGAEEILTAHGETKPNADYEQIVREELVRVQERLAQLAPVGTATTAPPEVKVAPDASCADSSSANKLDANITAFRAADVSGVEVGNGRPPPKRSMAGVLFGLLVAATIVGAGAAWAAYGEAVRPMIASWEPQLDQMWSQVSERLGLSGEQTAPPTPAQTATADTAPPPAPAPQAVASQAAPPPAVPVSPDVGQMLQSMAHDIASLQQGIDQLRAGQEQMARDNAKLAEQLKASQDQMARVMARASEASIHPRPALAAPPRPVLAARRAPPPPPVSTLPPPQPIAPPPQAAALPTQLQADDATLPVAPRPPKPVP